MRPTSVIRRLRQRYSEQAKAASFGSVTGLVNSAGSRAVQVYRMAPLICGPAVAVQRRGGGVWGAVMLFLMSAFYPDVSRSPNGRTISQYPVP